MTDPSAAERRTVDDTRDVLEPLDAREVERELNAIASDQLTAALEGGRAAAAALLRDIDAQGAEPDHEVYGAGYGQGQFDTLQRIREYLCDECDAKLLAAAPSAPAGLHAPTVERPNVVEYHVPTVEACITIVDEILDDLNGHDAREQRVALSILKRLRALTSGAEAGEREAPSAAVYTAWKPTEPRRMLVNAGALILAEIERLDRASGNSDRGASAERPLSVDKTDTWDEEHIKRRSIIRTPEGFKAIDRETTRPLSEWSDDELFREWRDDADYAISAELRKRGWRPHHGDKAPVEEMVEVRFRDGGGGCNQTPFKASELHWWQNGGSSDIMWLRAAARAWVSGETLPPPNGKGRAEAAEAKVAELEAQLASLRPAPSEEQVEPRGPVEQQMAKLREKYPDASIISERYSHLVTIPKLGLPPGWDRANIDVKFVIPAGYPQASPRDFWASPLHPAHGGSPRGTDTRPKPGIPSDWRRFMWAPTKWNPNSDDLLTFVNVIRRRLAWVV